MSSGANEQRLRDYLNRVTADLQTTRRRVRELEDQRTEPIAIVSMACRFPGGADTPEEFWDLIAAGADLVGELPADRGWDLDGLYHPDPAHPGTSYTRNGAFLPGAAAFDADFFGISPREALAMDPQQRLLLETSWEAVERAGLDAERLRGTRAGVFVGASHQGYGEGVRTAPEGVEGHLLTGGSGAVLSGRIAYTLGLEGPAVTVDTMCSSSLVALHLAVQALRNDECSLALAAGATVMGSTRNFTEFSRQSGLAVDGRVKAFSDDADGTGWGEGIGVLLLERLSDARRHGHHVLGVVRGSAVNQDGASNGLTAPNGPSQQRVIRQALTNAGVASSEVDTVEAHGTGTSLGDPIEAQALLATYGLGRPDDRPLLLASVKSNIGHTQAASGIAGVIKTVLAMRHGLLPRTLHAENPSTHVDWSSGAVELLTEERPWPRGERPRRAGVSSFGASGTNAHVILEEAPDRDEAEAEADTTPDAPRSALPVVPWPVSARTASALPAQAARLATPAAALDPADLGLSLATTRTALDHRAVVLATDADDLRTRLAALAAGEPLPGTVTATAGDGSTAFVFSGQGGQRVGMGRELADAFPVFAVALDEVCAHFEGLREVMFGDAEALKNTGWAQPALFAVEVALYRLVESWGVRPDYLVGHSVGELAAAHVAGVLSLADAARLVSARATLMRALPSGGAMWAVRATADEVTPLLVEGASLAAVNAPGQVVVSGTREAVESVADRLTDRQGHWLEVSHAFHSALMDPMLAEFKAAANELTYETPRIPIVSTLTGEPVTEFTAAYWADQVRGTVRFADALTHLKDLGVTRLLELGPDASLVGAIDETYDGDALAVPTLHRTRPEPTTAVTALARLWADGADVDWAAYFAPSGAQVADLPTYAFQRRHYWLEDRNAPARPTADPLDTWRYGVEWVPGEAVAAGGRLSGRWLVVSSAGARGADAEAVVAGLGGRGVEVVELVLPADADREHIGGALAEQSDVAGVVSLLAFDEEVCAEHPALTVGLALNVLLTQALADRDQPVSVWMCTRGAISAVRGDEVGHPLQGSTWGLGLVFGLEFPQWWGGLVDLSEAATPGDLDRFLDVVASDGAEDQIAVRGGDALVRRLRREPQGSGTREPWRTSGTALITGGTGGLGAHTARWLIEAGAEHLVLTSRRGADAPGVAALVEELGATGTRITVAACDVSDEAALTRLVERIEADGPPIRTVVHSAGVGGAAPLAGTDLAEFEAGADVKLAGTAHLDRLFDRTELDAFVLYSSVAAVWGAGGHGSYAAGNAYLEAVTRNRRARGLTGTTIAWGLWSADDGTGLGGTVDSGTLNWHGLTPMAPRTAIDGLRQAMADGRPFLAIGDVDWDAFTPAYTAARPRPLIEGVPEARAALGTGPDGAADPHAAGADTLRERLRPLPQEERERALRDLVRSHAATVLGHSSPDAIDEGRPLRDLGFDSLLAVELRNALIADTGLKLATTLVFDHPNVTRLAEHLHATLFGEQPGAEPALAQIATRGAHGDDAIAIIGMGCRFPGGIETPEALWQLVTDGGEVLGGFPDNRGWDLDRLFDPDPDNEGHSYVRTGGFVRDAGDFDPAFFGISPREALAMDPQQRLLLETAWEAIEHGRIDPHSLRGSECGVFIGAGNGGYGTGLRRLPDGVEGHLLTGTATSIASGRISYTLGLEGPAVTVDTGCSSALVAVRLAAQALLTGECTMALAGAASIGSSPLGFIEFSRQRGLAEDGRSKAFSEDADGMGISEGAGVFVLERLSDARRNGHQVLAVVRGSAMNQDGASNGLTAPNGPSQQRVIRQALANSGLTGADIDVVEAHGTGTKLGDPIEAQALLATYGQDRPEGRPLWLGSVKSNLGHTQAAAGVAGIMKMILAMHHGELPRTLHVGTPSSRVDWAAGAVELLTEAREWPRGEQPRRAGVSAFGVSGTNVHLILEEAPDADAPETPAPAPAPAVVPWVLSGRGASALREQAALLGAPAVLDADPLAVGWSLATTRARFEHRSVVLGSYGSALNALASGEPSAAVVSGVTGPVGRSVFVFPGQGAQWVAMGAQLLADSPVFAGVVAECEAAMAGLVDWSVTDVLRGSPGAPSLERVDVVQPASFVVMVALAAVWRSYGVTPSAVVGHSQGEIAAAYVAGALSLEDALRVVCVRSRAIAGLASGNGTMASVGAGVDRVEEILEAWGDRVSVAAVNGPSQVVISGEIEAVEEAVARCVELGLRARRIAVDYASHSPAMDVLHDELTASLAGITPQAGTIPLLSTVTGEFTDGSDMTTDYWVTNLRSQVRFAQAIEKLAGKGYGVFVEVSSHPVLTAAVQEIAEAAAERAGVEPGVVAGSLRRDDGGLDRFLAGVAELWVRGVDVDWTAAFPAPRPAPVALPTYPFQRQHYWLEDDSTVPLSEPSPVDAEFWAAVGSGDATAFAQELGIEEQAPLSAMLPALHAWRMRRAEASTLDTWRYGVEWVPGEAVAAGGRLSGRWLVVSSAGARGADAEAVVAGLGARGAEVAELVLPVDADRERIGGLLAEQPGVVGVVSLLAFDEEMSAEHPALTVGLALNVLLTQALADWDQRVAVWMCTRGAISAVRGDEVGHPVQGSTWGLGLVFGLEFPQWWGGLVDLPEVTTPEDLDCFLDAVASEGVEDQFAIRSGGALVRRLRREPLREKAREPWRTSGTALITGGTGGLGAHAARWLIEAGAEHLVLTSRRGADAPGVAELVEELGATGTRITVTQCDVCDYDDLTRMVEEVEADGPPIRTVIHCAGVGHLAALTGTNLEEFAAGAEAKLSGTANLDRLFDRDTLDAFVLYSSVAALWGAGEHGSYSAGNAYLDSVTRSRRARGLTGTTIAWGLWSADDGGMANKVDPGSLNWRGLAFMNPQTAMAGLRQAMADDEEFLAIGEVNWEAFTPAFTAMRERPLLDGVPEVRAYLERNAAPAAREEAADDNALRERLRPLPQEERERALRDLVRAHAATVLGHSSPEAIEEGRPLRELGFDSLLAVALRNALVAATGLKLAATLVFDYPNVTRLVRHLDEELFGGAEPEPRAVAAAVPGADGDDAIAIVGMSCRFPGGINAPEDLWRLVTAEDEVLSAFPDNRGWDLDRIFSPDPDEEGHTYVRSGGFVQDAGDFDPAFFGISPREALAMDPQQRLLLEVSWEAIEHGRIDPHSLRGTECGVFIGAGNGGYGSGVRHLPEGMEGHLLTGTGPSIASGRISYTLGLEGPAVTLDTGCSSALVALDLAVQALRSGTCSLALAGAASIASTPEGFIGFSRQRGLAEDGRSKAFSEDADGMGLSEGVGLFVVERLSDARRNGHQVLAVLRGSAMNQDGASNGLTAPNGPSQQRVIRQALANSGLVSADVDIVEAHGTGTKLGDPIEAQALLATYGKDRPADRPLRLGSVKSNLGHTQLAAGAAGVMKMILALRHGVMPKTLHLGTPSSRVDWEAGAIELLAEARPWPRGEQPRRAGVSAFGMSGTNVHVILEEAPDEELPATSYDEIPPVAPWLLSGRGAEALREQAAALGILAEDSDPVAVGWSLATTRARFEHRAVILGAYGSGLAALAAGEPADQVVSGVSGPVGRSVFVFPGQGAQWVAMGAQLLDESPVFAQVVAECEAAMAGLVDWSVTDVLRGGPDAPSLERVDVVQPASFVVMVALAEVWRSYGVTPSAVVGHSQGEIAAAYVAGALSLEDALRIVCVRSRAIAGLASGNGTMASVGAGVDRVEEILSAWDGRVSVAAVNGPSQVVISGEIEAVEEAVARCVELGLRARRIAVDYASHSPAMDVLHDELTGSLTGITPQAGTIPLLSTVTGEFTDGSDMTTDYWVTNLRSRVRFAEAIEELANDGYGVFVEVSSHPVLSAAIEEIADEAVVTGSLRRDDGGLDRFLAGVAELWVHGVDVDWTAAFPETRPALVDLPTYAFQRRHYWLVDDSTAPADTSAPLDAAFWAAVEGEDADALAATLGVEDAAPIETLLPALSDWRRRRRQESEVDSWLYDVQWQPLPHAAAPRLDGERWLLLVPDGGHRWSDRAAQALGASGARVRVAEVTATDRAELAAHLREAGADSTGVLSLLASGRETDLERTALLVQALGDAGLTAPLWLATQDAVSVGPFDRTVDPGQAGLWGLGRIAALEYPQRFGGLVDLPDAPDARAAERLVRALTAPDGEDQLAVRAGGTYVRRLVRKPLAALTPVRDWRPAGTVLVTGGTGGVGAEIAAWLAENGAEHLLLTSRRGDRAPGAAELTERLTGLGARVTIAACDVTDREALRAVLGAVPADAPLTGVVHAAAVLDDCLIDELTPERVRTVLGPKAIAAHHLHELTKDAGLDAFVLLSSMAGTLGGPGQGSYAAANARLDALALLRRAEGLPATSLAWGAWARVGLATGDMAERMGRSGVAPMAPETALRAIGHALDHDLGYLMVGDIDWPVFGPNCTAGRAGKVLDRLPEAHPAPASGAAAEPAEEGFAAGLAGRTPAEREQALSTLVRTQAAAVLGLTGPEAVDPDRALRDLGFDSITAVELRNRLNTVTGLRLPVTVVFDHTAAGPLAQHLYGQLFGQESGEAPAALAVPAAVPVGGEDDPVVIVGMGCRFPGGIETPEQFWELLAEGGDAVTEFPTDRGWDLEGHYDPDRDRPGTYYARGGGFLRDVGAFDPVFFGISPRVAPAIDPQHRLLLETSWEAFERAGIDPATVKGTPVGVFVGSNYNDYGHRLLGVPSEFEGQLATGSASSVTSGRVAYTFGLEGPAVTVDTACSSSLVALHLAAQSVRSGECAMALAGGVTVMSTQDTFIEFSRQGALSPDGRCRAFSADADGAGWAEGVGMLLVERLSDARRHGHPVLAVVRASAVNQDGASNGLTAPNGLAQQRVIRQALANGGLSPADVDLMEAHGTGTSLGDPIEADALLATYGQGRSGDRPLWLGSVKSNIGHTQAASGVAGVIKTVLAMRHATMPGTLHASEPTPHVDWSAGTVRLLTEARAWPEGDRPRRAAVSSFGVSGTNVHMIIEQAPAAPDAPATGEDAGADGAVPLPFVLSARSAAALTEQVDRLKDVLDTRPETGLAAVGRALAARSRFEHRLVAWSGDRDGLRAQLDAWLDGRTTAPSAAGTASGGRTAFLFSGQGAQRLGMGRELYETFPVYADAFDEVCAHVDLELPLPLRDVVFAAEDGERAGLLDRTEYTQPALFAVEVALYRLLESWGVRPDYLIGHSVGELAAAHLAGVFTLPDACRLVVARGRLMGELPAGGAMAALAATEDEVLALLAGREDRIAVAAVNAPDAVVVSGDTAEVDRIAAHIAGLGGKTRRLRVSHAFHSPHMDAMLDRFAEIVRDIPMSPPTIPLVSDVTGETATADRLCTPAYWVDQLRGAVRFADGVRTLTEAGVTRFLEVGPDAVLAAMARDCRADDAPGTVVPLLRRGRDETRSALGALAELYVHGGGCDWSALLPDALPAELPTYPFQRRRYWLDARPSGDVRAAGLDAADHPLLGAAVRLADDGALFTARLSRRNHPWLGDHVIAGRALLPGTAFLELAVRAGDLLGLGGIGELTLQEPLVLPETGAVQIQVRVGAPDADGARTVEVHSRADGEDTGAPWRRHAGGTLLPGAPAAAPAPEVWPPAGADPVALDGFYGRLAEAGSDYGPVFQGLRAAWRRDAEVFAEVSLPEGTDATGFGLHPALLDAALQAVSLGALGDAGRSVVPFSWQRAALHSTGATVLRVALTDIGENTVSVRAWDPSGTPAVSADALAFRPVTGTAAGPRTDLLMRTAWQPLPAAEPQGGSWAVIGHGRSPGLTAALTRAVVLAPYPSLSELADAVATGTAVPDRVLVAAPPFDGAPAAAARAAAHWALELVQGWLGEERLAGSRLVFVTRGAVAAGADAELTDLPAATVHGLVRAAITEHPGRFALLDLGGGEPAATALATALTADEPQTVLRGGTALMARLARVRREHDAEPAGSPVWNPDGTTLVTGATGTLGRLVARHLVTEHGVRRLLLISRSGLAAPGAAELEAELTGLGAEVTVAACDAADRNALRRLLDTVPAAHPLTAVVHAAGVVDDGVITSLTPERIDGVLAPKADAAVNLHDLTADLDLDAFVLFSSIASTFGGAGQGAYAAGNAFLDALASHRRALGLSAVSLCWGPWTELSTMTGKLDAADHARFARAGIVSLSTAEGLELLDASRTVDEAVLVPVRLSLDGLDAEQVPPLLRGLVRAASRPAAAPTARETAPEAPADRFAGMTGPERARALTDLVRDEAAVVLAYGAGERVDMDRGFLEMGFDSLSAVELRNRLGKATGLTLPATLLFDYPTPAALAAHLDEVFPSDSARVLAPLLLELEKLGANLPDTAADDELRGAVESRLRDLLDRVAAPGAPVRASAAPDTVIDDVDAASDDEIFQFLDGLDR